MFGDDDDDRSEAPSQRRLDEAAEKGDTPQSPELAAAIQAVAAAGALALLGGDAFRALAREVAAGLGARLALSPGRIGTPEGAVRLASSAGAAFAAVALPTALTIAAAATLGTLVQRAPVLAPARLLPDFSRLDPFANAARLLGGGEGLGKLVSSLLKAAGVAAALAWTLGDLPSLVASITRAGDLPVALARTGEAVVEVLRAGAMALLAAGVVDLLLARRRWLARLGMTKQEVRREAREEEGDPHVKGRLRRLQREVRQRRGMLEAVKTADVVLANPTHVAVALKYDRSKMAAPRVVARGTDRFAEQLKAAAREAGVVVLEDPPLARALLASVRLGGEVPPALYQGVAKALAFVHRLRGGRP